tara:strand:- start:27 stop:1088 length:1062 start_codon:yes stop_codon:yes gene_type:complete
MAIIDKPSDYFNTMLYTANGAVRNITEADTFQADLVWLKRRNASVSHHLVDSVRGATKAIYSNTNASQATDSGGVTGFVANGFSLGTQGGYNDTGTFVSWTWKSGTSFTNDASATGIGTIDSAGSVNTDSGFSIISYTGTATNGTIAHGLGVAPSLIIIKNYSTSINWSVNSQPLNASLGDYTRYLTLDSNGAVSGAGNTQYQNSAFTSSVFNVGTNATTNGNGNSIIAYCFANVQGFSKTGTYVGNGNANGTFVYTGFKPAWVMYKSSSLSESWKIYDAARQPNNVVNLALDANSNSAEDSGGGGNDIDFLSNGFKQRGNDSRANGSGATYIYMAFAENPLVASNFNAATAR